MPRNERLARRAFLTASGTILASPAMAQPSLDTLFRSGSNALRSLSMTEPDEIAIGRGQYRPLLAESGGAYPNQRVQAAIRRFAAPLFATSGRKNFDWEITVLDDNSVNAWVLPAGKLAVNKGLLRYAASESELAAVIAHEIGHAELSHHLQAMRRDNFTQAMTAVGRDIAVSSLRGPGGALTAVGIDALQTPMYALIRTGFSREAENEADKHILTVFRRTGHDPAGAIAFFRTMLVLVPAGSDATTSLFSTHPGTQARIAELERESANMPRSTGGGGSAAAFAELKQSFPTRRNYRGHGV